MGRTPKVDRETALAAAQAAFMQAGFDRLGTRELETRTGITRFTLQTEFGGKKGLLLAVLDAYLDAFDAMLTEALAEDPIAGLAGLFRMRASDEDMPEVARYGCMMLTAATEFGTEDSEVNTRTARYLGMFRDHFSAALSKARDQERLHADVDCAAEAEHMTGALLGLNALIRAEGRNSAGKVLADTMARHIEGLAMRSL